MKIIKYIFICSFWFSGLSFSEPNDLPVIKNLENTCWDRDVEIQGRVSMDSSCISKGTVYIKKSHTVLDCNGAQIDVNKKYDNSINIDSGGNPLSNISIKNCVLKNSKFRSIYIGWNYSDREKEKNRSSDDIYKSTPSIIDLYNISIENPGSSGIYIDDYVQNVVMDGVKISNAPAMAIYFDHNSRSNILRNSEISNAGWQSKREAISIDSSSGNIIESNLFENNLNGSIFIYRNCGERFFTDETQVLRKMTAKNNIIRNNKFSNNRVGIWIASRQSLNQENIGCGIGYYAEGKYALDDAKNNIVQNNYFDGADIAVIVEDDNNKIMDNRMKNINKIGIRIGTPIRSEYLSSPVVGTLVYNNKNYSSTPGVRYMWGSQ